MPDSFKITAISGQDLTVAFTLDGKPFIQTIHTKATDAAGVLAEVKSYAGAFKSGLLLDGRLGAPATPAKEVTDLVNVVKQL